jgi:hypothetical protein
MGLKEVKSALLKKGWAGRTLSRPETVERLNPLIKQHMALNHAYTYVINTCTEPDVTEALAASQKVARVDVGKLMETVFSCGGVAYNGVDLEPEDFALAPDDDAMLFALRDQEEAFRDALAEELTLEHQMRTRAVLTRLQTNSQKRLDYLKINTKRRRPKAATS